jgi:hypothetical protein
MTSHSWDTLDDGRIAKKLDFSSFNYKGSVIPKDFYYFFGIESENKSISLVNNGIKFDAEIEWENKNYTSTFFCAQN